MPIKRMVDLDLQNQRVLIREDLNVPLEDGKITSDKRIRAALPTIEQAAKAGAKVIVMSHLGRPEEGVYEEKYSLAPVAARLSEMLGKDIPIVGDRQACSFPDQIDVAAGEVVLVENVRFNQGEKKDNEELAKKMAAACDIFVMDAFATAHRAQASTHGVAKFAPIACAGPLLITELEALGQALKNPAHPLLAIVAGSKVSTKLMVLENLINKVDQLIVGGGIANTFIAASGFNIGKSLAEVELIPEAKRLITAAQEQGTEIPIPTDVIVAKEFSKEAKATIKSLVDITDDDMILDIGPKTSETLAAIIKESQTILWNGPVGVFEFDQFGTGTKTIAQAVATSNAFSVAGGGDTVAAIEKYGVTDQISYISTAGGAFLEFIEGKQLPAVAILEEKS